jgi:hypothetical protein
MTVYLPMKLEEVTVDEWTARGKECIGSPSVPKKVMCK